MKTKAISLAFGLILPVAASVYLSSCVTSAVICTTIDISDRAKSKKSTSELLSDYVAAKSQLLDHIGDKWTDESEKDLVYEWGAPTYSQEFDNREKLLIYEAKAYSSITTGGDTTSKYNETLKETYTRKEAEVTTVDEKKGTVKVSVKNNRITSVKSQGSIGQLDKILIPSPAFAETSAYKAELADCDAKLAKYNSRISMGALLPYLWGGALGEILSIVLLAGGSH